MLNTAVFPGMLVEKCGDKSLKITGMEDDAVKVFLIQVGKLMITIISAI